MNEEIIVILMVFAFFFLMFGAAAWYDGEDNRKKKKEMGNLTGDYKFLVDENDNVHLYVYFRKKVGRNEYEEKLRIASKKDIDLLIKYKYLKDGKKI